MGKGLLRAIVGGCVPTFCSKGPFVSTHRAVRTLPPQRSAGYTLIITGRAHRPCNQSGAVSI